MTTLRSQFERSLAGRRRAPIGVRASPVERWVIDGTTLWVKRDDLNTDQCGGNKARALQFLLGEVHPGTSLVTVGGEGSTHVLATATHGTTLGMATHACRWRHEMNPVARRVSEAIATRCVAAPLLRSPALALLAAGWRQVRHGDHWIPFGGTSPLGMQGHVEAALELADQVAAGDLPAPARIYVAYGTGGTAAGLALGFALAQMPTTVVAVRCGPSLGHEAWWMRRLVRRAADAASLPADVGRTLLVAIDHAAYAGAYGRPKPEAVKVAGQVHGSHDVLLDDTYAAKACYAAISAGARDGPPLLFWHTFDARWMT